MTDVNNPNTNQSEIIDKIRKLLALSSSPNEHEAALAAARVEQLLQQHKLTLGIVEHAQEQKAEELSTDFLGTRLQPHVWVLASACNVMFDTCYFLRGEPVDSSSWRWQYNRKAVFIGLKVNVEEQVV